MLKITERRCINIDIHFESLNLLFLLDRNDDGHVKMLKLLQDILKEYQWTVLCLRMFIVFYA